MENDQRSQRRNHPPRHALRRRIVDLLGVIRCSHDKRPNRCISCKVKRDISTLEELATLLGDLHQAQKVMNIVLDAVERNK